MRPMLTMPAKEFTFFVENAANFLENGDECALGDVRGGRERAVGRPRHT